MGNHVKRWHLITGYHNKTFLTNRVAPQRYCADLLTSPSRNPPFRVLRSIPSSSRRPDIYTTEYIIGSGCCTDTVCGGLPACSRLKYKGRQESQGQCSEEGRGGYC